MEMTKQRIQSALAAYAPRQLPPRHEGDAAVALILSGQTPALVLCVKSPHLRVHAGEVSFPGGKHEPVDDSSLACAIRETEEEIGVQVRRDHCLGMLNQFQSLHGLRVTPWVFWHDDLGVPAPRDRELKRVFQVPMPQLLRSPDGFDFSARRQAIDQPYMPYWVDSGERIWGLTALILAHFLEVVWDHRIHYPSESAIHLPNTH
jgi:8-oxo-dGTP pyrophosphatase MutT (NUDIX family)